MDALTVRQCKNKTACWYVHAHVHYTIYMYVHTHVHTWNCPLTVLDGPWCLLDAVLARVCSMWASTSSVSRWKERKKSVTAYNIVNAHAHMYIYCTNVHACTVYYAHVRVYTHVHVPACTFCIYMYMYTNVHVYVKHAHVNKSKQGKANGGTLGRMLTWSTHGTTHV